MDKNVVTLGADPEMFVRNIPGSQLHKGFRDKGNVIVPVCGLVGGTKETPIQFPLAQVAGYKYQEDNVTFEVNIPPCDSVAAFSAAIRRVRELSEGLLAIKGLKPDYARSAVRFGAKDLQSEQAMTIGCDPDMCAYGGEDDSPISREPFDIKQLGTWRFAGGHVHFGYDVEGLGIPHHVVARLIDACVYLPLINQDKQKTRRQFYGLAGLYRPKPYGIEYRTMSNFWLTKPRQVADRAFNLLHDMNDRLEDLHAFYQGLPTDEVKKCIDSGGKGQEALIDLILSIKKVDRLAIYSSLVDDTTRMYIKRPSVAAQYHG